MMNLQDKINALPLDIRKQIAYRLDMVNSYPGLTDRERQRERELVASWVSSIVHHLDAQTIEENNAMDNFKVSK